ncbi:MAG: hypothetical protein AB1753_03330 [Thermoproteota archaeon]
MKVPATSSFSLAVVAAALLTLVLVAVAAAAAEEIGDISHLLPTAGRAYACSCIEPGPPAQALAESDRVFVGKVLSVESANNGRTVTFEAERAWKGIDSRAVTLNTASSSASCGYDFEEGKEYLVYAQKGEVSLCSRTAPAELATADYAALGEAYDPVPGVMTPEPPARFVSAGQLATIVAAIVAAGGAAAWGASYILKKKKGKKRS